MRLDLDDESVEVFSKAPNVDDEDDPGNLGKGKPLPLPQLPLPPTSVGDITAAPSDEIRSSTPSKNMIHVIMKLQELILHIEIKVCMKQNNLS